MPRSSAPAQQTRSLPSEEEPGTWQEWLFKHFPHVCTAPFGKRHVSLWEWFISLERGTKPRPRVEVWPRGGAKSATAELATAHLGVEKQARRKFVLYVCATQDQADKHVASIASLLEQAGVERRLNKFGSPRAWRRNQLQCKNGFTVEALGLDTATRGIKVDEFRPDLIIFDDIDNQTDTPKTVEKKETAIKSEVITAGSNDVAVLVLQNLIHEIGIVNRIVENKVDFLLNREVPTVEPAVIDLVTETVDRGDGLMVHRVVGGTPTWEGQSLSVVEEQINEIGLRTFLRECQHEVKGADGYFFTNKELTLVSALPEDLGGWTFWLSADFAATQDAGDWTAVVLMAMDPVGVLYVVRVWRKQYSADNVRKMLDDAIAWTEGRVGAFRLRLKQDPGQAGKDQAEQLKKRYKAYRPTVKPDTGSKAHRAETWAEQWNTGNVRLVSDKKLPDAWKWNWAYTEEHRQFREDEEHEHDDMVDASADGCNAHKKPRRVVEITIY
ncbi:MAG: hypothetical protein IH945_04375 [Armatimonadetes bacterium]|nr:hypothetical protein [Armatimonadota bacterium]